MQIAIKPSEFPVRLRLERSMTDEELLEFCAVNDPLNIERDENGDLIVMTPNTARGGGLELRVAGAFLLWAREDGRGEAFGPNSGFTLPDKSMRAPDVAWISWPRWNALTAKQQDTFAPICPEFVIEIRSKRDRLPQLQAKMTKWIANGAQVAWLLDPQRRIVEIYRPDGEVDVHQEPTSVVGDGPVRGFELVLSRVWG